VNPYIKPHLNVTTNRRITNIEPQNFEEWFRSAQSFINGKIPSFDIRYSLFDIRYLSAAEDLPVKVSIMITPAGFPPVAGLNHELLDLNLVL